MAIVNKIDSNRTETRFSEESSIKVANGSAVWNLLEVNSFGTAAANFKKVARDFITADRQRAKGITTDLDATIGFNIDLCYFNAQTFLQGLFFADLRKKVEFGNGTGVITSVTTTYNAGSGLTAFAVGDLVFARNFDSTLGNNGLKKVTTAIGTALTVTPALTAEATPPAAALLVRVGVETAAGDLDVDATLPLPALTSTTLDFTTLGLTPGESIWIGGDTVGSSGDQFAGSTNNCLARIRSIAAHRLVLDKTSKGLMTTESNTTRLVRIYFGRVLRNEFTQSLIKRRTYQIERQLGATDDSLPSQIQSEYMVGAVFDKMTMNYKAADKITMDVTLPALDQELRSGATGLKAGTRPNVERSDAQVTSIDLKRVRLAKVVPGNSAPTPLYTFINEMTLNFDNMSSPLKALTVLGGYDYEHGDFMVSGSLVAQFFDVASVAAIRNNDDVTIDVAEFRNNQGWSLDLPLLSLGDASIQIVQDKSVSQPITFDAASGAAIDPALNYTALMTLYDFLPNLASSPNV